MDEFAEMATGDVEDSENSCAGLGEAVVGSDFEEGEILVGVVWVCCFSDNLGAEDDGFVAGGLGCHLFD